MQSVHLNGNKVYFAIDDEPVQHNWISGAISGSVAAVSTNAGAGLEFEQRREGLQDRSFQAVFQFNEISASYDLKYLRPGIHKVTIGPEGNVPGKPKHEGMFILESSEIGGQDVSKAPVNISVSGNGTQSPIADIFDRAVFS